MARQVICQMLPLDSATWTEERIQQEIAIRLPQEWFFTLDKDPVTMKWWVKIFEIESKLVWESESIAPNLALLDALGWLELQFNRPREVGPWMPRGSTQSRPHDRAYRTVAPDPDPDDIDPDYIESVYKKRKGR